MSIQNWMGPAMIALDVMVAQACDNEDTVSPEDVTPLLIVGGDMGAQSQNLSITRQGQAVTDAVVTVNGVPIPHTGGGLYRGHLPAVTAAGSHVDLQLSAGEASVRGNGQLPEAPILTAPRSGTVFAPTDSISHLDERNEPRPFRGGRILGRGRG